MDLRESENAQLQLCQAVCSENSSSTSWLDTQKSMDTFGFKRRVSQNANLYNGNNSLHRFYTVFF